MEEKASGNGNHHRIHHSGVKIIKDVRNPKDVANVVDSHNWELDSVEQYGEPGRSGEAGMIATMTCIECGAECGIMIIPSGLADKTAAASFLR